MVAMMLFDDQFLEEADVHVSPKDRGYYFGDGVYEVFRVYNGTIYEKQDHLQRLTRSADAIRLKLPYTIQHIEEKLETLLQLEKLVDGTLYMQITRGAAPRNHIFPEHAKPVLMAYCSESKRPLQTIRDGITAIAVPDIRWHRCDIKSLNLLPNTMAKQEAVEKQAGEAILHRDGIVTECSASNVMIVKDGMIRTHPANHHILHGITRGVVLRLADQLGYAVSTEPFTLQTLLSADEVFITGTTAEVTPVTKVDDSLIGDGQPGPITKKLQTAFEATIPTS